MWQKLLLVLAILAMLIAIAVGSGIGEIGRRSV